MNWLTLLLPYLPPVTSIVLLGFSHFSDGYLKTLVDTYETSKPEINDNKNVIKQIVLDCSGRLGFFNSMLASVISCVSITATQEYAVAAITLVVLVVIFGVMVYFINKTKTGDLEEWVKPFPKLQRADLLNIILVIVNIVLIIEIFLIQHSILAVPSTSK